MSENIPSITENEWYIMEALWETKNPCTSMEIIHRLEGKKDVSKRTIRVMLNRLVKKHAVDYAVDKNNSSVYHYFPLVQPDECLRAKNRQLREAFFGGSTELMLASMVEDVDLTEDELDKMIRILEQKKGAR